MNKTNGVKMSDKFERIKEALTAAVRQTMENMTFEEVSAVSNDKVTIVSPANVVWASLPLKTPYAGNLLIDASVEYSESLVHEVYGFCEDDAMESSVRDVLSELANTIAGRFFGGLVPEDEGFELGLPDSGKGTAPNYEHEVLSINLKIGEHFLKVSLFGSDFINISEN